MAHVKRGRGRPRKSRNRREEIDTYIFYDTTSEEKEFTGDVFYPNPSIIEVKNKGSSPDEWAAMVTPKQTCVLEGCGQLHVHCPLCPASMSQFSDEAGMKTHFTKIHTNQDFRYSDHVIVLCNLGCMESPVSHYHCPKCGAKIGRSLHMRSHLNRCTGKPKVNDSNNHTQKKQKLVPRKRSRLPVVDDGIDNLWDILNTEVRKDNNSHSAVTSVDDANPKENILNEDLKESYQGFCLSDVSGLEKGHEDSEKKIAYETQDFCNGTLARVFSKDKLFNDLDLGKTANNTRSDLQEGNSVITGQPLQGLENDPDILLSLEYPHISIVRKLEDLPCRRCQTCCRLFHCPLCPRNLYRSQLPRVLLNHLNQHYARGVQYKGWTSMKCNLACGCQSDDDLVKAHWHCPLCPQRKLHRSRLREHLDHHQHGRTRSCRGKPDDNTSVVATVNIQAEDIADKEFPIVSLTNKEMDTENDGDMKSVGGRQGFCVENSDQVASIEKNPVAGFEVTDCVQSREDVLCQALSTVSSLSTTSHTVPSLSIADDGAVTCDSLSNNCDNIALTQQALSTVSEACDSVQDNISLISDQNRQEIHILYIKDLSAENGIDNMERLNDVLTVGDKHMEQQVSSNDNMMITGDDNIIVHIDGDGNLMTDDGMTVRGDERDNSQSMGDATGMMERSDSTMISQENNGDLLQVDRNVKDDDNFDCWCANQPDADTGNEKTTENNQAETTCKKTPEVFQVVTGVLTTDLTERLQPVLDPFLSRLQDLTGVTAIHQDTDYLLQGSWIQIYKSQVVLDKVSQWNESANLDVDSVFDKAQQDHPELFGVQESTDHTQTIQDQNPELCTEGNCVQASDDNDEGFRISSNEPCPYCLKKFRYKVSLFCHIIYTHNIKKKPKINCDKWQRMLQKMAEVNKPQCPSCGRKFTKIIHAQTHYGTNVCTSTRTNMYSSLRDPITGHYKCEQCSYTAITPSVLMQHVTYKHMKKAFRCPKCEKMFATLQILQNHMKNVHIPEVTCSVCGVHVKRRILASHMRAHQRGNRQSMPPLKCSHCDYYTNVPQLLERHTQREHCLDSKTCSDCGKRFQVMFDLYQHRQREHGHSMSKFLSMYGSCPICRKHMLKRNILIHIRLKHCNDRRYKCNTCAKAFQTRYVLDMHKQTHLSSGERCYRYICPKCNMGFMTKTTYADHLGTHTSLQPYKCDICGNSFRQKNAYRHHLQTHRQTKHICDLCQLTFDSKESLIQHLNEHEDGAITDKSRFMFVCLCGQAFEDMATLQEHTGSCAIMQQEQKTMETSSRSQLLTEPSSTGNTLIVIQPETGFISDSDMLATSQPEMFIMKADDDGFSDHTTDTVREDIQSANTQCLDLVQSDEVRLADQLEMSMIDGSVPEQDGFLCGYCSTLFVDLEAVQKHIVIEHGDKLSN